LRHLEITILGFGLNRGGYSACEACGLPRLATGGWRHILGVAAVLVVAVLWSCWGSTAVCARRAARACLPGAAALVQVGHRHYREVQPVRHLGQGP
jgi:hypothetical protein